MEKAIYAVDELIGHTILALREAADEIGLGMRSET